MIMESKTSNPRMSYWGPRLFLVGDVIKYACPTSLTFDSDTFLFDSHCPMFSYDGEVGFTFDSSLYLMSSTFEAHMDEDTA